MLKKIYILIFLFLTATLTLKSNELLKKAEAAYESKNYAKAIECYEEIIKEGFSSDKLFYNLGNAYYKNKKLGKAIYNYELAKKINPKNEDVLTNLEIAYSKTIDKIETKENFFISAVKSNVLNSFSTETWAWLSIIILFFSLLTLFVFFITHSVLIKRISFFSSAVLFIGFFAVYFLGYSALKSKQQKSFAIITSEQTKIHTEPSASSSSKFSLHEGTRVKIIDSDKEWALIKLENSNEGWVKISEVGIF